MYTLTPADLSSTTDAECAFGTTRLLPAWEEIPDEFKRGNQYTRLASAIFFGSDLPGGECFFLEHFEDAGKDLDRTVRAHLRSFAPKHEHKIAGVGYLISKAMRFEVTA